ncbi:hypothetical protein [Agromyces humi]|uniref:hypothetical protein n=1 Tax=Agromyces humi TaxID=1766800 RepID=UPI001357F7B2|nr:hypothetical protein [Agromyces humi]
MPRSTATRACLVAAILLILAGCAAPSPVVSPSPSTLGAAASPTPTPTEEPTDPLSTVDGLVARPAGLELRADGAVVTTLDYMSSPADAVTALTTVFGAPPADEPYSGTNHTPPGVFHRWDQFVLDERFYDEERRQAEGYGWVVWPRFGVYFDGPAADGVVLSTSSGLQAGQPWMSAEADPGFDAGLWTCRGTSVEAMTIPVPSAWTGPDRVNVIVAATDDGATVKWIGAPQMEADGCA